MIIKTDATPRTVEILGGIALTLFRNYITIKYEV